MFSSSFIFSYSNFPLQVWRVYSFTFLSLSSIFWSLSQIYFIDFQCITLMFVDYIKPLNIALIALLSQILLFFSSTKGVEGSVYLVFTYFQTSYPCAHTYTFILLLQSTQFFPLNTRAKMFLHSMIFLPVVKLLLKGLTLIPTSQRKKKGKSQITLQTKKWYSS